MTSPTPTGTHDAARGQAAKPIPDVRGFWRVLLAIIAPLPLLAKGLFYLLSPVDGDAGYTESVAALTANRSLLGILEMLDAVFVVGLIPATIAVAWVARRGAPRLTTVGAVIALTGFFSGIALLGGVATPAVTTVDYQLDAAILSPVDEALHSDARLGVVSLLFLVGIVIGLGLLGAALWRSRSVPAWMGIALIVGGATHPFIPGHVGQGIGLLVAAIGFVGAGLALVRMRNSDFDLPATGVSTASQHVAIAR